MLHFFFLFFHIQDRHAGGNSMPVVDLQQNNKLLSLTESDGKTVMKFQRSIDSCDKDDLRITVSLFNQFYFNCSLQRKSNSTPACNPSHSLFVRVMNPIVCTLQFYSEHNDSDTTAFRHGVV